MNAVEECINNSRSLEQFAATQVDSRECAGAVHTDHLQLIDLAMILTCLLGYQSQASTAKQQEETYRLTCRRRHVTEEVVVCFFFSLCNRAVTPIVLLVQFSLPKNRTQQFKLSLSTTLNIRQDGKTHRKQVYKTEKVTKYYNTHI